MKIVCIGSGNVGTHMMAKLRVKLKQKNKLSTIKITN